MTPGELLDLYAGHMRRLRRPDGHMASFTAHVMNRDLEVNQKLGQFYPVVPGSAPRFTDEHGARFAEVISTQLVGAPVYQITAEMCDAIDAMHARTMAQGTPVIYQSALPSRAGFAWLDRPHEFAVKGEFTEEITAVSWAAHTAVTSDGAVPAMRIALWQATTAIRAEDGTRAPDEECAAIAALIGDLTLFHSDVYALDQPMATGQPGPTVVALAVYLNMLWTMLGMEVAAAERAEGTRGARRRAEPHTGKTDVLVVTLRRAARHAAGPGGHREIDWTCRWLVMEHWRHREMPDPLHHAIPSGGVCTVCGGQVSHVRAYFKGPDGAPIKVTRKLHRLSR